MSSKKIYVASSWRNPHQPCVVGLLRKQEHIVYDFRNPSAHDSGFTWSDIDVNWKNWNNKQYVEALKHPIAEAGFKNDFDAMKWADTCVLVLPCGRSAHTEAGWMKGQGKTVYVLSPDKEEPELMYKVYDGIYDNLTDIIVKLEETQINSITDISITLLQLLSNAAGASFEDENLAVDIISETISKAQSL